MAITTSGTTLTFNDATTMTTVVFPAGTVVLFYQAAAPTGWTQVTTQNNKALRVVSGTGGVAGGTTAFSTVFANQTPTITTSGLSAGATTLSTSQIPSHTHTIPLYNNSFCGNPAPGGGGNSSILSTGSQGGGGSHSHSISGSATSSAITLDVQYVDIILASKN
jgi:hypothetical protein